MRKILAGLFALFLILGVAAALPMFGPAQGFRNPGNVEIGGTLSIGGANIVAGSISYDDVIDAAYTNETAINSSIAALTTSAYLNESAINTSKSALLVAAYTNETAINSSITALTTATYINETAINSSIVDLTTTAYTNETAINGSISDLTTSAYVNETAINGTIDDLTTAAYVNETAINTSISDLTTGAYTNETAINTSISDLTTSAYINETTINTSIDNLELPLATFCYNGSSADQNFFTARGAWTLTGAILTVDVPGADVGAVSALIKLCDSGEDPGAGDAMTDAFDLKDSVNVPQSATLTGTVAIANGKMVGIDFTGTLTSAVGHVILYGKRA